MAEEFTDGQSSKTTVEDAPLSKIDGIASPSSNLTSTPNMAQMHVTPAGVPLIQQNRSVLETEWLNEINEKRILHRWILSVSLTFIIIGTFSIVAALFTENSIISIKVVGGCFADIVGGAIVLFWKGSHEDTIDRWKKLNRAYEYDRLINDINLILGQIKNDEEKDKFIVKKGGELFDALIDLIKRQND